MLFELFVLIFTLKISQQPQFLVRQMDADALLAASWAEDVARHAYGLIGFQLPRVPSLVPDLALQAVSNAVTPSLGWSLFVFAAVQFQLLLLTVAAVVQRLCGRPYLVCLTIVSTLLAGITYIDIVLPGGSAFTTAYFEACYHTGPYILALLASLLAFRLAEQWRWRAAAALAVLVFLTIVSDRLVAITFVIPAMVAVVIAVVIDRPRALRHRMNRQKRLLGLLMLATVAAAVADLFLNRQSNNSLCLGCTPRRVGHFATDLVLFLAGHPLSTLAGVVVPIAAWLLYPRLIAGRSGEQERFARFCWTLALFSLLGTTALTALLVYDDVQSDRYFVPVLLWPIILLAASLCRHRHGVLIGGAVGALVLIGSAQGLATTAGRTPGPVRWRSPVAECLLGARSRLGLKAGIAEYWSARPIMMASNWRLQIAQAELSGRPQVWGNDAFWYVISHDGSAGPPLFNYIVMTRLQPATIRALYGLPDRSFDCANNSATLWIYDDAARLTRIFLHDLQPPPGPYLQSCTSAVLGEKRLFAACATAGNGRRYTSLARPNARRGPIANRDGYLVEMGSLPPPLARLPSAP